MTLICYVKPQMFLTSTRPLINDPPFSLNQTLHSLICFSRLQGLTINAFKVGFLTPSKVLSLSAQSLAYEAAGPSGFGASRPRVFSTPRQVCSSRRNLRIYSTPLALPGFLPSKSSRNTIGILCQDPCSFIVSSSSWLPSISKSDASQHPDHAGITSPRSQPTDCPLSFT
jgi:hypothetical protein